MRGQGKEGRAGRSLHGAPAGCCNAASEASARPLVASIKSRCVSASRCSRTCEQQVLLLRGCPEWLLCCCCCLLLCCLLLAPCATSSARRTRCCCTSSFCGRSVLQGNPRPTGKRPSQWGRAWVLCLLLLDCCSACCSACWVCAVSAVMWAVLNCTPSRTPPPFFFNAIATVGSIATHTHIRTHCC